MMQLGRPWAILLLLGTAACRATAGGTQDVVGPQTVATAPAPSSAGTGSTEAGVGAATGGNAPAGTPAAGSAGGAAGPALAQAFVFSPYKDVAINANWNTNAISTAVLGSNTPLLAALGDVKTVTWSFASGECGSESWGGIVPAALAEANVAAWATAGKQYILGTGGAAGVFTCGSDAAFFAFIDRYASPGLVGIDFDIESSATQAADVDALMARVQAAQANAKYKNLRFSFTIATLAGSGPQNLGPMGIMVMNAIKKAGLKNYYVNLMAMDYASSTPQNCALGADKLCDMGASAIAAAESLHSAYGVPYAQIELTPMIGGNDTLDETFKLADVATVVAYARKQGLGGLHYWSWDRDVDCPHGSASPTCNTYGQSGTLGFVKAFLQAL